MATYKHNIHGGVIKDNDIQIPDSGGNRDWQEYQAWLAAGNIPEPADPIPDPRIGAIKMELADLDRKSIRALRNNETDFLQTLELQAEALRAELGTLTGP